jgi:type I restriction-modification system DNA methylase subunit
VPIESGKEKFFAVLQTLIAKAKRLQTSGFDEQEPEAATCHELILPLLSALGFRTQNIKPEFKVLQDSVDYLLKSERPLIFVEAKSLLDCPKTSLFDKHREQVHRYIQNYRLSPEITAMEQPVKWILLTNFAQLDFIRVNEVTPSFSFKLTNLWERRDELWELLALENLEANRIDEVYDQHKKASLDQQFLADLKRWRLLIANGFALRNQNRSLEDITLASQQLLDRFIFCLMLETQRLVEYNKLARAYGNYEVLFARANKTFGEVLRESLFVEIKNDFNTELFEQPLLCDQLEIDNVVLSAVIGHEPLAPELAAQCGFESGQGERLAFRHLYRYDFSLMSSDVMGSVYERFLAHKLFQNGGRVVIEDTAELRKKEGIYYTPRYIVDYIVAHTLGEKIKPVLAEAKALLGYKNYQGAFAKICRLSEIKVLDPAMGSGSFLLGAFDALVAAYKDYNAECEKQKRANGNGDALFDAPEGKPQSVDQLGTRVVEQNLFGVDLDQQAVEVAKLNLWIRLMAAEKDSIWLKLHDPANGKKSRSLLPALTNNFKRGNSLIDDANVAGDAAFDWKKKFPETMKSGGFDVVIGNPPYVAITEENCGKAETKYYKTLPVAEYKTDLFHFFIQRGIDLVRTNGKFGYIVPNPWLTLQFTSKLRHYVLEHTAVQELVVFSHRVFQDADVHTALLLLEKKKADKNHLAAIRTPSDSDIEAAKQNHVAQSNWNHPPSYIIETRLTGKENALIERLVSQFPKLELSARASLGCQAYNSSKHTAEQIEKRVFHAEKKLSKEYLPELAGNDVSRYKISREKGEWIKYGPWLHDYRTMDWLEGPRILIREISGHQPYMIQACYVEETYCNYKTILNVNPLPKSKLSMKFLTGLLNSRLMSFAFPFVSNKMIAQSFPRLSVGDIKNLPIASIDFSKRSEKVLHDKIASLTNDRLLAESKRQKVPEALQKNILHTQNRTPCNLAHYLQKDFADSLKPEILIADVQQTGFVHEIKIESAGSQITLSATVANFSGSAPASGAAVDAPSTAKRKTDDEASSATRGARVLPILRLTFKNDALRQFIYASWVQFLNENSRKHKWTKGKKPEAIYPLLVNTLEPLVYFSASAGDNLRAIRDLMKSVAEESGSTDLAAIESEIEKLDTEIDERVYELYGLTQDEIKIVESAGK